MNTFQRIVLVLFSVIVSAAPAAQAQVTTTIDAVSTGLCVDVYRATAHSGTAVIQHPCRNSDSQRWQAEQSGGYYTLRAMHSGQCLDIFGASAAAGTPAIQYSCAGSANQQFTLHAQGAGHAVVARHSGLCLGVEGASMTPGARLTQQACNGGSSQTWRLPALDSRAAQGEWSAVLPLPLVPVAAANLPNGNVLMWSSNERLGVGATSGRTYTLTYNPATGVASEVLVSNTGHDMFCPGTANLADGRIHVTGGVSSSKTSIYDPATGTWSTSSAMNLARGYNGAVTLSNGDVFTIGGSWSGGIGNKNGEVWSAAAGAWRSTSALSDDFVLTADRRGPYRADNHAWLFTASGGRVFHAGPSKQMNWFDTDGNGVSSSAGLRGADNDAMNGNAVMYASNRILTIGGAPNYADDNAATNAFTIDLSTNPVTVQAAGAMAYARAYHSSVTLPSGDVLVVGGQSYPVPFSDDRAVLAPELWSRGTRSFRTLAPMSVPRTYHSVALLLPDGRVLSGGGGLCGGCTTNHADIQIYSPPYLFNADGEPATRPVINQAPAVATVGSVIPVRTDSAISAFALVRLSSITHAVNNEQRRIGARFFITGANEYAVIINGDRGVLVPGYYMLFALNRAGVPSVSRTIRIQ